jgi:hypothetical protein
MQVRVQVPPGAHITADPDGSAFLLGRINQVSILKIENPSLVPSILQLIFIMLQAEQL